MQGRSQWQPGTIKPKLPSIIALVTDDGHSPQGGSGPSSFWKSVFLRRAEPIPKGYNSVPMDNPAVTVNRNFRCFYFSGDILCGSKNRMGRPSKKGIDNKTRPVHSLLLGNAILIVEHMCHLEQLPPAGFLFSAIPPKFEGVGTFPVRAYAKIVE